MVPISNDFPISGIRFPRSGVALFKKIKSGFIEWEISWGDVTIFKDFLLAGIRGPWGGVAFFKNVP